MKRIISLFICIIMCCSIVFPSFNQVNAAGDISTEELFMKYPIYLNSEQMKKGLTNSENAYREVLRSYSEKDETIAAYMTAMSQGISLTIKDILGKIGVGETLYEQYAREAATRYMKSMLANENFARTATSKIDKAYKSIKTSYSIESSVGKAKMSKDLYNIAKENDISIEPNDMDELVDKLYESNNLKNDLAAIGEAMNLWKIVLELTEIHAIEKTTLNMLLDELSLSGQKNSDLYLGLSLLKKDIEKDAASYVLKYYATDKALKFLTEHIDEFFLGFASGATVTIATIATKLFADYVYQNAKADELIQATMHASFVDSIEICLLKYRIKFLQGKGNYSDIEKYKNLYNAFLAAHVATLELCNEICKKKDATSMGKTCLTCANEIKKNYTYDNYINWCKAEYNKSLTHTHNYKYDVANEKCKCGATLVRQYENAHGQYTVVKNTSIKSKPYASYGERYVRLNVGDKVTVKRKFKNVYGNTWCEVSFGKHNGYAYLSDLKKDGTDQRGTLCGIKISVDSYPKGNLPYGKSFTLSGKFTSNCAIVEARAYMLDENKNVIMEAKGSSATSNYYIKGYALDNGMKFNELSPGAYYLKYYVKDANGDTATWISDKFYIVDSISSKPAEDIVVTAEPSTLDITLTQSPSTINQGSMFGLRGTVTSNYKITSVNGYIINSSGSTVQSTTDTPNAKSMDIRYANVNQNLLFDKLSAGEYTLKIVATDVSGKSKSSITFFTVKGIEVKPVEPVVTPSPAPTSSIRFELEAVPSGNLPYGKAFSLKGWFRSDCPIVEARAYMLDANKNVVMQSDKASSTTSNYKIQGYKLDKAMKFNELNPGAYYLKYYVRDANGDTAEWISDKFYIVK